MEVDYDRNLIIIHSKMPKSLKGYVKSKMDFTRSFPHIKGTFEIAGKQCSGDFMMDSGSAEAMILDSAWAARQNFDQDLLFSLRSEINRRKKGNSFNQSTNPFANL